MFPFDRAIPPGTFLDPLLSPPEGERHLDLALVNTRTGKAVATTIEPALDSKTRGRGLLGRTHLDKGAAMIIAPCTSVHMFFMKFAIDVVFVRRDGRVVKIARELRPWRIAGCLSAFAAIEFAPGGAAAIDVGDNLAIWRSGDLAT